MKKTISTILAIVSILICLCSCGAKVECDFCGKEYRERKGETREVLGDTIYICSDCYSELAEVLE